MESVEYPTPSRGRNTMRKDLSTRVLATKEVAPNHVLMRLTCDWGAAAVEPGQFFHLRLPNTNDPLLRRPYTIYRLRDGSLDVLFQVVGKGTELLSQGRVGDSVRILGPLGVGFTFPPKGATVLVVGGGVGMASLFLLVERLVADGYDTRVLLGARSHEYVLCRDDLHALGVALDIATDDGSEGFHGFVTDLLREALERYTPHPFASLRAGSNPLPHGERGSSVCVYACGPTRMMEALSKITLPRGIPTQVALENRMGCAMGVCLGCVVPIETERGVSYLRVCTEGPVFDASAVRWEYRV